MTAYSFKSYATREAIASDRTPLLTIQHGHPLNNDHRAPFSSGITAARGLLVHAQRELSDPVRGSEYFNRLRQQFDSATINGQRVKERLRQRQARAATALANSDVELTAEQLQIVADIALVQADIGGHLLSAVTAAGKSADAVIDQIDNITRQALRSATLVRTEQTVGAEVDPNEWTRTLSEKLHNAPDADRSDTGNQARTELVLRFSELIYKLEENLPLAVDRDEPLYEIDEALDPLTIATTRDRLSEAMGSDFNPTDIDQNEELDFQARQAIWQSMSMDEREFAATKIALTPAQRIEVGMQIVNSTPPLIRLPEAELGQGRFDVRMATEEESRVMDTLIRYAGETRTYPGPEIAGQQIEAMKELSMTTGVLGRPTIGFAVANVPQAIAHAKGLISKISTENPEARFVIHADNPQVAAELQQARIDGLATHGIDAKFKDGSDATREFGGWTLADNGEDRILGNDPRDAAIFVANVDKVWAYNNANNLVIESQDAALDEIARNTRAVDALQNDVLNTRQEMEASRDQNLVAEAKAIAEAGRDDRRAIEAANASANPNLVKALAGRENLHKAAVTALGASQRKYETIIRQAEEKFTRAAAPGDIARATIVDLAQQHGKLAKVYVPGNAEQGATIQTSLGQLSEQRGFVAQQKAQRLRNVDSNEQANLRRLFHSARGVDSTLIDGSNFFREDKGAAKGFAALRDRLNSLAKTATILTSDNSNNAISKEVVTKLGRPVIHATAWRVSDISRPIDTNGRAITLSDRKTELDLGLVGYKGERMNPTTREMEDVELSRPRDWSYKDLKGAVVVVRGGGSMSRETFDAIQNLAVKKGLTGHSLSAVEVGEAYNELLAKGHAHLEAPKIASPQLSRAIMQEALVDYANQVDIASDMGKDYHSATLIRLAADADKLASVTDKVGNAVPLQTAYDHSKQFAHSIADNTRKDLDLDISTNSEFGQLVLSSLPKVTTERAALMAETYGNLGDVMRAAEANEPSAALPRALHHDLSRPNVWSAAISHAAEIEKASMQSSMGAISATNELYPQTLKDIGQSSMLYTMGDIDLNTPTLAMVIGGNSKPLASDIDASLAIAKEAKDKGWAVSIHLSGETSASVATAISQMPAQERPRILLVGDGHPNTSGDPHVRAAFEAVGRAQGAYVTTTPPVKTREDEISGDVSYRSDRRAALELQGRQASAVVVVKSSGNDVELLALRAALNAQRPVAAVGPANNETPGLDDLRFRGAAYSANQRLLAGGNRISVMLENRHLSFQPNFIPDMTAQAENRYIPFEGSTAGMMNAPDSHRQEQTIDNSAIETGGRMNASIAWKESAEYIPAGNGVGAFIEKVEMGQARDISAKEADIAAMARQNDMRFLDTSHRMSTNADVVEMFQEVSQNSQQDIDADTQAHFLAQRAGMGR